MTEPVGLTGRLVGVPRSFKGKVAVSDVDLQLEAGRIYGLLGPNGAGRTTTLRLLLGLISSERGTVELFGRPPDDAARARVGYVPEHRALPDQAKVEGALGAGLTAGDVGAGVVPQAIVASGLAILALTQSCAVGSATANWRWVSPFSSVSMGET